MISQSHFCMMCYVSELCVHDHSAFSLPCRTSPPEDHEYVTAWLQLCGKKLSNSMKF